MEKRNIENSDIGNDFIDGITNIERIIFYEVEIEQDVKDALVLNNETGEAEKIIRYGSNKADD
jgi:hypothetical protein